MTPPGAGPDRSADAGLALDLFTLAPHQLGGLCLRGAGPAREAMIVQLSERMAVRRLPAHIDDERLLGGIDIAASLAAGRAIRQTGLLEEMGRGVLLIPMAERLSPAISGRLAQALDSGAAFGLVLLDDSATDREGPPAALTERVAFRCDLTDARPGMSEPRPEPFALSEIELGDGAALTALAVTATALGIDSVRALMFALTAARAHAALNRRIELREEDLQVGARLVLAPRATRLPPQEDAVTPEQPEDRPQQDSAGSDDQSGDQARAEDTVLEAALAAIPADLLARLADGAASRNARGSGGGNKTKSPLRGKPLGARPGIPCGGARLALVDTLRAAIPWQPLRRRELANEGATTRLLVRKPDLRIRRFEERAAAVTIFCVDASGSAAMARLAEAKGAVELMLAQAYVTRSEVALVAFRGTTADVLLPPTRSLTRARRALAELPGGGGTPLATGITTARKLAEIIAARGHTPFLVLLTDGSTNIAADGTPGRAQARTDADAAARAVAASHVPALVVDISPRPRPEPEALARVMQARYLPLPMADAAAIRRAVDTAQRTALPA